MIRLVDRIIAQKQAFLYFFTASLMVSFLSAASDSCA